MATRAHAVDALLSRFIEKRACELAACRKCRGHFRCDRQWPDVFRACVGTADGDHGPVNGEAFRILFDQRRRFIFGFEGFGARWKRTDVSGRTRSSYAYRAGLAACLASQT